jgi:hypothetical protein
VTAQQNIEFGRVSQGIWQGQEAAGPSRNLNRHIDGFAYMLGGEFHGIDCEVAESKDEAQRIAHALRRRYQAPERGVSSDRLAEQVRTMVRLKAAEIAFRELPRIAEHLPYEMRLLWAEVLRDCADALDRGRVYRPRQVVVVRRDGTRPLVDPAQAASHAVALTGVGD